MSIPQVSQPVQIDNLVADETTQLVTQEKNVKIPRYSLPKAHYYGAPLVFGFPLPQSYVLRLGRKLGPPVLDGASEDEEDFTEQQQYRRASSHWVEMCKRAAPNLRVEVPQAVINKKLYSFICLADNSCPARMKIPSQRILDEIQAELEQEGCKTKPMWARLY